MTSGVVTVQGVEMTAGAAGSVVECGVDVAADVARVRSGESTEETLLEECLDGANEDREQDWRDYVTAVAVAAGV